MSELRQLLISIFYDNPDGNRLFQMLKDRFYDCPLIGQTHDATIFHVAQRELIWELQNEIYEAIKEINNDDRSNSE